MIGQSAGMQWHDSMRDFILHYSSRVLLHTNKWERTTFGEFRRAYENSVMLGKLLGGTRSTSTAETP